MRRLQTLRCGHSALTGVFVMASGRTETVFGERTLIRFPFTCPARGATFAFTAEWEAVALRFCLYFWLLLVRYFGFV